MKIIRTTVALALVAVAGSCVTMSGAEPPSTEEIRTLLDQFRHKEAREMAEGLLAALEADGLGESVEAAELLDLLLRAARARYDSSEDARHLAQRAIALKERLYGPDHPSVADTLGSVGVLRMLANDYDEARTLYDRCLAIREKALGPDDPLVAVVLLDSANLLQRQGRFTEALPVYERALSIREKRLGPNHADVASVLHNLGNLRLRMGDFVQSRNHYQRAVDIRRSVLGPRHIDVALTLITMGVLFQKMGDYDEARDVLEQAIPICREVQGPDSMLLSTALNNLGNVHWSVGEAAKARDAYLQALDIKLRVMGPDHPDLFQELNNLALAHKALGEYDAAIPLLERAIRVVEKKLGSEHYNLAPPINNLANLLVLKGRLAEARPLYERAFSNRVAHLGPRHPEVAESIMNLAGLSLAEGKRAEALALAVESSNLLLGQIRDTLAYLPESDALHLASLRDQPHALLFEGLRTAVDDTSSWLQACWSWTLQRKGIVLEEMAARNRRILEDESSEARVAWEALASARTELGTHWASGPTGSFQEKYLADLKKVIERKESAEARLAEISAPYRDQVSRRRADLAALRRSLRPGEALVEFARVEVGMPVVDRKPVHDIALIVGPGGTAAWKDLGPAEETDRLVNSWRTELAASFEQKADEASSTAATAALARAGEALRQAIWDPVARHLAGATLILIVPDGALHQVDFAALAVAGGRFLVEEVPPMQLLSAARDLLERRSDPDGAARPRSHGVLALGSPDFNARVSGTTAGTDGLGVLRGGAESCAALRDVDWAPLPEAIREVEAITSIMKDREPVTALTGAQATVEALLRQASGRRILHIATHGFFLGSCGEAAANPLLLSGLVLAGANATEEGEGSRVRGEGILTAEGIAAADLRSVDLAVLSACDTGRGEVAVGEGVFGLRRALEIAGVRTVVMSLWPVPDRQARRWMVDFYRAHVIDGATPSDAARRASLTLLEDLRARSLPTHPYMWTGFVVAGAAD